MPTSRLSGPDFITAHLGSGLINWDDTVDVIVLGGGLAGLSAALAAAAAGAQVLLLEKQANTGGTSALSGGAIAFAGTPIQARAGIQDSAAQLLRDLERSSGGAGSTVLRTLYAEQQLACYQWLCALGVEFSSVQMGSAQSVARSNRVNAQAMMDTLAERAREHPLIKIRTQHCAVRLVRTRTQSRVCGVVVEHDSRYLALQARTGVVLATGGFARNRSLIHTFAPELDHACGAGAAGSHGDGLYLATALGAGLAEMGYLNSTFGWFPKAAPEACALLHPIYKGAIAINQQGLRFCDESASYKTLGIACLAQSNGMAYQIFDERIMDLSVADAATSNFQGALTRGEVIAAQSLAQLAARIGVEPDTLQTTVDTYNHHINHQLSDPLGRSSLANGSGALQTLNGPVFYAYPSTAAILGTYGGISVDPQARVLDVFGQPIAQLFAAGELTGGFHGAGYMTGSALGQAVIYGRIAGQQAAQQQLS